MSAPFNVTPIDDSAPTESSDEGYIKDLESEIDALKNDNDIHIRTIKRLSEDLKKAEDISVDLDYKIKYHQLLKTFHTTLAEFLPFG